MKISNRSDVCPVVCVVADNLNHHIKM